MSNEIKLYENNGTQVSIKEDNYIVAVPGGGSVELLRSHKDEKGDDLGDGDFGVIPGTHQPSLFKSGADKIRIAYGFFERHTPIESLCLCDPSNGLVRYVDKCELVKLNPQTGQEYVFASYIASANSYESRNGKAKGSLQVDNNTVKIAQKRSMVSAVISVANLSKLFTMDIEDEKLGKAFASIAKNLKDEPISKSHVKKLWSYATEIHVEKEEVRGLLDATGYKGTDDIKKKDFGNFLDLMAKKITVADFIALRDGAKGDEDKTEQKDRTDSEKA